LALKAFQNEEWPAKKKNSDGQAKAVATAEQAAMRHSAQGKEVDVDDQETVETHETEETGTDITKEGTDDEDSNEAIAEDSKPAAAKAQQTEEKGSKEAPEKSQANVKSMYKTLPEESFHHAGNIPVEDDPLTREPVHPAIVATVEAFMMVLQDPAKYPRPCELALEGVSMIVANRYLSGRAGGQNGQSAIQASLLHRLLESVAKCAESNNEAVQIALISTMTTIMTSPKCSVHDNSMLTALRSTFHVYLVTKAVTCKASAKRALLDMLKAVFFRMEAHDAVSRSKSSPQDIQPTVSEDNDTSSSPTKPLPSFASQYHADAYYLFRSLCKLSSKELPADTTDEAAKSKHGRLLFNTLIPTDPTELNSKILSLELILAAMEYSGEAFTSSKFLYLVQHYLCGSLLKNCVSNHTQVAFLSQKIFLVLVRLLVLFLLFGDAAFSRRSRFMFIHRFTSSRGT
jgi:Guanine nucleotide exchange factor in Golgi transport N-terminal/Dimerisation and cyclophilin-binding domain of Mon2